MSTRCEVGIYPKGMDSDIKKPYSVFYKHCDGYPEGKYGMVALCKKIWKRIAEIDRFEDETYFAAQALYAMMRTTYKGKKGDGLQFGIQPKMDSQGDTEYYYAIFSDRIECYNTRSYKTPFKIIRCSQKEE